MKQLVAIAVVAASSLAAGCASYSERVVEKPVPARPATVVYTDSTVPPATTTTVYQTR